MKGHIDWALDYKGYPGKGAARRSAPVPVGRCSEIIKSEFFAQTLPRKAVAVILNNLIVGRTTGQSRNIDFSPWVAHTTAYLWMPRR